MREDYRIEKRGQINIIIMNCIDSIGLWMFGDKENEIFFWDFVLSTKGIRSGPHAQLKTKNKESIF